MTDPSSLPPEDLVVDAHVHLLPGRLGEKVRAFMDQHLSGQLVYPIDHGIVRERLAAEGVHEVWTLPYAHKPDMADGLNASTAEVAARTGGVRVVGGATVHPADADPVVVVRRAVEDLGLRVLKLHCSVGEYGPDDRRLDGVWEYASAVRLPVVVHAGHSVSGLTEDDELHPIGVVARRHPEARIVIAHCGHRAVGTALDLLAAHPNVYADLTPVVTEPVVIPPERLAAAAPKLLFGSDAPNTGITVGAGLAGVRAWPLDAPTRAAVLGGTAHTLITAVTP